MKKFAQIISQIPPHLRQYVVEQDYARYTPIDQATWRFILRQLKNYLSVNAHKCYVEGLTKTGIDTESIPRIDVMCEKLQQFGWTAVPVSGFIPPAAFMEMQSLSLLPIACDMRTIDHILYTPAPDIVHEAAGHAPILIDPQFASYLKDYAQVAKKAIISSEDLAQYEAIRDLSDIKENPDSTPEDIAAAEKHLQSVNASISHISEAALLGRMNWWTAEYGLIGDIDKPQIFGAGLLSSVGEARNALKKDVKKIPLSVDCINTSYDITEQQPQLYVAKNFSDLSTVLKHLEDRLSFKKGGAFGLQTAQKAATVNTVELNSGLQVSGKVTEFSVSAKDEVIFYKMSGAVQLCENGVQIQGHGSDYHAQGFSSPLGFLKNSHKCLSDFSSNELKEVGIIAGSRCVLTFASGITVDGRVKNIHPSKNNKIQIIAFEDCTVKNGNTICFHPEWGVFDMAVGSQITSVFAGPADRSAYGMTDSFVKKLVPKKNYSERDQLKHKLYQNLRDLRADTNKINQKSLMEIVDSLVKDFPNEWLAFLEALEISYQHPDLGGPQAACIAQLKKIPQQKPQAAAYINLGLELAQKSVV